jgi:sporulation protein YlmC with PRC-barrel domain
MNTHRTLSATSLIGDKVRNPDGQNLGKIEDLVLDLSSSRIAYAVLSFGGFLGMGDKFFAVPFSSLTVDFDKKDVVLPISKEVLEKAEGFDKSKWPDFADNTLRDRLYKHYSASPYWN